MDEKTKQTKYGNTDLVLITKRKCVLLVKELDEHKLFLINCGSRDDGYNLYQFEHYKDYKNPAKAVSAMLTSVEALSPKAKRQWGACKSRTFDIVYDCGDFPFSYSDQLSTKTINRLAKLKAAIALTLYGHPPQREKMEL